MKKKYFFISSLVLVLFSSFSFANGIEELSIQNVILEGSTLISAKIVDQYSEELCVIENLRIDKNNTFAACGIFDSFVSLIGSVLHVQLAPQGEDPFAKGKKNTAKPEAEKTEVTATQSSLKGYFASREEKIREAQNSKTLTNYQKREFTKALQLYPTGPKL